MSEPSLSTNRHFMQCLYEWQQGDFSLESGTLLFRDFSPINHSNKTCDHNSLGYCDEKMPGFVVISQTCDIVREPIDSFSKFVSVCPLVEVNPAGISNIEKGKAPSFGLIENTPDNLVVDFSRIMSVSKNLLVTWRRRRGCPSESKKREFAIALERFFGRYAYPDAFNQSFSSFRNATYEKYNKNSNFGKVLRSICELRVYPHSCWNNTDSVPVTLIVVIEDRDKREIEDREEIYTQVKSNFDKINWVSPFSPHEEYGIHIAELRDLSALDYLNSYPLDLNSISYAKRYKDHHDKPE